MKKYVLGVLAALFAANGAMAAEVLVRAPYHKVDPVSAWTGFYAGVVAGYGDGETQWTDDLGFSTGGFNGSGATLGVTGGYNWQSGRLVYGVEGDVSWANIRATTQGPTCFPIDCRTELAVLATLRARAGYLVMPGSLIYVTAGLAAGELRHGNVLFQSGTSTEFGWVIGAGLETNLAGPWNLKGEYLYIDLGSSQACNVFSCGINVNADYFTAHLFRLGLNRLF